MWTDDGSSTPSAVSPPTTNTATTPGQWHAAWGGRILDVSQGPGYYRDIQDLLGGFTEQSSWGVTASGLPVVGGLITLTDLASGHIDHAIGIMVPEAAKGTFVFPPCAPTVSIHLQMRYPKEHAFGSLRTSI